MLRFALTFLAIVIGLFAVELSAPARHAFVMPWTDGIAQASIAVIRLFDPHAVAFGNVLASTRSGFAVSSEPGCNGIEAALILIAAIAAFPAPWKRKVAGILAGVLAIQSMNILRVVTLFYLGQWSYSAFEWAHLYAWQALIMVDVLVVWLLWVRWVRTGNPSGAAA